MLLGSSRAHLWPLPAGLLGPSCSPAGLGLLLCRCAASRLLDCGNVDTFWEGSGKLEAAGAALSAGTGDRWPAGRTGGSKVQLSAADCAFAERAGCCAPSSRSSTRPAAHLLSLLQSAELCWHLFIPLATCHLGQHSLRPPLLQVVAAFSGRVKSPGRLHPQHIMGRESLQQGLLLSDACTWGGTVPVLRFVGFCLA